ncbi:MAG: hypothetical protein B9S32_00765 [Verrucomicrobia bacterium Tous-C9LFEB]|nr:MAG: hypothetical protein B9S32_00765 [Verrucomicrobia bacterium Tous-C9LFEB]
MLKHRTLTHERISKLVASFDSLFWKEKIALSPTVSPRVSRISYAEAMRLKYTPVRAKQEFGPRFSTYWFKIQGVIPRAWRQGTVDLIFNTRSEGTIWLDGKPVQGLNPAGPIDWPLSNRIDFRLPSNVVRHGKFELAVEMSCNQLFGYAGHAEFRFEEASLALFDAEAWQLYHDLFVPWKMLDQRADKSKLNALEGFLLARLNDLCNVLDPEDRATWSKARPLLDAIYARKNGTAAVELSAIGHAHIDTAWLWPLAETRRKCIRSFSSALKYMDEYPEYKFSCSQAFQYQWMKDHAPSVYAGIQTAIKRGQWIPVGGTWIEPDCNTPSGESLVRQFFYGKRFFRGEFGWDCKEFWNPDVFGYNGQLPQIMKLSGIDYFLTQKLSWNQFNKPQHQNFIWKGIDGTGILTHFPPADTYNAMTDGNSVQSLQFSETNHQDLERTSEGLLLYGWGDGGGGPTRHMLEVLRRARDLQGLPRTQQRASLEFFKRLEKSLVDAPVIEGELYLEYHRATYTTQAANKRDNRASELALRRVELLGVLAAQAGLAYPAVEIERLWKIVLLNQFHDILPGSSITEVYQDSARDYAEVLASASKLETQSLQKLTRTKKDCFSAFNALGWSRRGLVRLQSPISGSQITHDNAHIAWVETPSLAASPLHSTTPQDAVQTRSSRDGFILENEKIIATFGRDGCLHRLLHKATNRETLPAGTTGNRFVLFDDRPVCFDAWDVDAFHLETRRELPGAIQARLIEHGPLRAGLEFSYRFDKTRLTQRIFLETGSGHLEFETEVDWQHRHKFLKVEFPVNVHAREAAYETAFGLVRRPTTFNNSLEMAQFEVPGHRWMDFSEPEFGAALFTDSKYGYACHGNVMRLSLLRGPTDPDPKADLGHHRFRYAFYPHAQGLIEAEVVRRAHEFNQPLLVVNGALPEESLFTVDSPHLILDTVKQAADSKAVIVRLYECHGARGVAQLRSSLPVRSAVRTNLLEEPLRKTAWKMQSTQLTFKPFEIITMKLTLS